MLRAETVTLADWIRGAEQSLARAGVESSRHEAERLAALALDVGWGDLWMRLREPIDETPRTRLEILLARRCGGEPLAYIRGSVVFHGIELECGPGVLVPRPETETLVDVALELIAGRRDPIVVDIGTGTGAIAIAVAHARPDAEVWATDVSSFALDFAARNIETSGVNAQLCRGDLFDGLPDRLLGSVNLIVSNPPYIPDGMDLPADVLAEPAEALRAGPRGDELLVRLVDGSPDWLNASGALALEVGTPDQTTSLMTAMQTLGTVGARDDHNSRPRVVWAAR